MYASNIMNNTQSEMECVITGRVQMIMFRDFACRRARKLGISGTVQNLPDGSVRVIAQGQQENLIKFIVLLKRGPLLANVQKVQITWREPSAIINGFSIIY